MQNLNNTAYYTNAIYIFYLAVTTYGIKLGHLGNTKIRTAGP